MSIIIYKVRDRITPIHAVAGLHLHKLMANNFKRMSVTISEPF